MIPCCKLEPKTFFLNSIKKVIIFITWKTDPKFGFSKLYYINCDLISTNGMKESLFENAEYSETKLNAILAFFRKYFDTEFKPAEENDLKTPEENIEIEPPIKKGEATPVGF